MRLILETGRKEVGGEGGREEEGQREEDGEEEE